MNRKMPSIHKRDDSSRYSFRMKVPRDLVAKAKGQRVAITFPATAADPERTVEARVGTHVKLALGTKDDRTAKERNAIATAHVLKVWERLRHGPLTLTHRQITALSKAAYDHFVHLAGDDPGGEERWTRFLSWNRAVRENRIDFSFPVTPHLIPQDAWPASVADAYMPLSKMDKAEDWALNLRYGDLADWVLDHAGLEVPPSQRRTLIEEIDRAVTDAAERLLRAAQGDYRPDPKEARFPAFESLSSKPTSLMLTDLFDRWKVETKPSPNTVMTWTGCFRQLREFLGHDDAKRLTETDVIRWKDQLLAGNRKTKTVNDSHLTALRSVLAHAVRNRTLPNNPASGVRAAVKVVAGEGALPYTDDEVKRLLTIASKESNAYKRWLPLLAAATGARIGELAQLHGSHVVEIDGVQCLKIEPTEDGGRLKNAASERMVPLHPTVIDAGFLGFVRDHGHGPLFYRRSSGIETKRHASKGVANHLGTWIREQGFSDPRKAPSHGFRHWWKSAAFKAGVPDSIADHIQGHKSPSVAARYRHFGLPTLSQNVDLITIPVPGR